MQDTGPRQPPGAALIPCATPAGHEVKLLQRLLLLAIVGLAGAGAGPAEDLQLSPDSTKTAAALRDRVAAGSRASDWVKELNDLAGPRLAGSPGDRAAVAVALEILKAQGFANVRAEKVIVPVWHRESESGEVTAPVAQRLALAALGGSIATPAGGIEAEVVGVRSFDELEAKKDTLKGKIVFYDVTTERSKEGSGYGKSVVYRSDGASRAAKYGAVGALIRSIGTDNNRLPHTGSMSYAKDQPRIPSAALSIPDADLVERLLERGKPVRIRFTLACGDRPNAESANVIGEVPGRETPGEIVAARRAPRLVGPRPGRRRRRRGLRHRDRGRAPDRRAPAAPAPDRARRPLRQRGERPRRRHCLRRGPRGGDAPPRRGPRGRPRRRARVRLLVECGARGAGAAPADRGAARRDRRSQMTEGDYGGADISRMIAAGVPLLGLSQDASTYFDLHHTANDTFDKIVPKDMDQATAAAAVIAWSLAELPGPIERVPAAKRKLPW